MSIDLLFEYLKKPAVYSFNPCTFWDDEHISKGLLEAHLNAGYDAASRKHHFIERSASWIAGIAPPDRYSKLLDLGCGPGLYAECFNKLGYSVTGIDFSGRSINYAAEQSKKNGSSIEYIYKNYLNIDYTECYDVITIIYCDYGALSAQDRKKFRDNAFRALRPGGKLILDCFSLVCFNGEREETYFEVCDDGGFWSEDRYIVFNAVWRFPIDSILRRHVVLTEDANRCYDFFERCYSKESLEIEIKDAGFTGYEYFGDIAGKSLSHKSKTVCGVFTK